MPALFAASGRFRLRSVAADGEMTTTPRLRRNNDDNHVTSINRNYNHNNNSNIKGNINNNDVNHDKTTTTWQQTRQQERHRQRQR
eukprot:2915849-Karenia_brevis.AAC.1